MKNQLTLAHLEEFHEHMKTIPIEDLKCFAIHTDDFCLEDIRGNMNEGLYSAMVKVSDKISEVLEVAEKGNIDVKNLSVRWCNIPNEKTNPRGEFGFFRIIVHGTTKTQNNAN